MELCIANHIYEHCQSKETISALLAEETTLSPQKAASRLFGAKGTGSHVSVQFNDEPSSERELKRAYDCGRWGSTKPSQLFLQAFHDALCCLNVDPLLGVVSPSLMGSQGRIVLSMVSPLVEITHHCANIIAKASKEVILVTCSWSPSVAAKVLCDAFSELSRKASDTERVVSIKILIGNPGPAHLVHNYKEIRPGSIESSNFQLPNSKHLPNLDMEVVSVHKPLLGTLHAKFLIIDRRLAIIQSNNIEDNCNLEMMTHLEGPIVESIYDYALITFNDAFKCCSTILFDQKNDPVDPLTETSLQPPSTPVTEHFKDTVTSNPMNYSSQNRGDVSLEIYEPDQPFLSRDLKELITRSDSLWGLQAQVSPLSVVNQRFNETFMTNAAADGPELAADEIFRPYILHNGLDCPVALVGRQPHGGLSNHGVSCPQNGAWISCIRHARSSIFIQTPDLNASPLLDALTSAIKRGVDVTCYVCLGYNDSGELMPRQGGTNEHFSARLYRHLSSTERNLLHIHWFVAKDQSKPIHHSLRQRACHLKLLVVDNQVGIQGSGNMDTQSWAHSQEINILVDSEEICSNWRQAVERNQNTAKFGRGSQEDGIWRDEEGHQASNATPNLAPPLSWAVGALGVMKKAQEKGGFA